MSPTTQRFDAIIIGVGQAGKPLAMDLAKQGRTVAVIERKYVGGTCINYGCTPTKTLVASAQVAHMARQANEYGVHTGPVQVNFEAVKQRKNETVAQFRQSIEKSFDQTEHLTLIYGEARFSGPKQLDVALNDGGQQTVTADLIFIDCGTSALKPDIEGLDTVPWLDSTAVMDVAELPEHLIILGGGYISLEFGQMFTRFGSRVTLIERGGQLLGREDPDMAEEITTILRDEGLAIHLNTTVEQVRKNADGGIDLHLVSGDKTTQISGSHLLVAIGTTPNTPALNLDAAGVAVDEKGFINTNDRLETNQPGIYALGDIKGGPAFTHVSYDDYRIIKQNLLGDGKASITGRMVPYTVFIDPQFGRVGLSETQAREKGLNIKIATMPMTSVARAIEVSQTKGRMKVIVDADTQQILGAAILGMEGGEIMSMLQIAMMGKIPYTQLKDAIFAHPTLAEALNNLFSKVE